MDQNEQWVRRLFALMEQAGLWMPGKSGKDALHVSLGARYGVSHMAQLRAAQLREFTETAAKAAGEKVGGGV